MADLGARALALLSDLRADVERARAEGSRRGDAIELLRIRVDAIEGQVNRLVELEARRDERESQERTDIRERLKLEEQEELERKRWWRSAWERVASREVIVPLVAAALSVAATHVPQLQGCVALVRAAEVSRAGETP